MICHSDSAFKFRQISSEALSQLAYNLYKFINEFYSYLLSSERTFEGTCKCSRDIFLNYFFGDRLTIAVSRTSIHII